MSEQTAAELIEDWQTGAFFLLLCCIAGVVSALFFGSLLGPIGAFGGFFVGTIVGFLFISAKLYG
ncbi:hypothetical protein ACFO0N_00630 [Halobium salinum]|uniref:DUF8144 domain-containing protein n=1 Tax=Halobium salinum TaxID=1364940 RepID=A0ABD5P7I1_9EURY|nr:hypothetical protein [Halobium salinum]